MKLDNLLFETEIKFENGKILTAILDFIKANNFTSITKLYLHSSKKYDLNTPLMSLTKIKGLKHFRYYNLFLNDDEKALLAAIEDYLNGRKDELDLQDAFLVIGYDKAAKF